MKRVEATRALNEKLKQCAKNCDYNGAVKLFNTSTDVDKDSGTYYAIINAASKSSTIFYQKIKIKKKFEINLDCIG